MEKEELIKPELPKKWEVFQLKALQVFAGSLTLFCGLYIDTGSKIITKAFGVQIYAILLAISFMISLVSGFASGTKGWDILIMLFKRIKLNKDE